MRRHHWLLALGGVGLLAALVAISAGAEELARGQLVSYSPNEVVRYRLFGAVNVYASPETTLESDPANSILLGTIAGVALFATALLWSAGRTRVRDFFLVAAVGALLLAFDEIYELNETLALNIGDLPFLPAEALDVVYVVLVIGFLALFWRVMLSSRSALKFWIVGLVLFAFTAVGDYFFPAGAIEEKLEPVATAFLLAGFTVLALERVRQRFGARVGESA